MVEVISVGGLDYDEERVAIYSSRGISTSELAYGMGIMKPDFVTYSRNIVRLMIKYEEKIANNVDGECEEVSGTSMAVSVITGALSLLLSSLNENERNNLNPTA